jgi:adenosylcobyric acid synthase
VDLGGRTDGAISLDHQIIGTYLHGLFESTESCNSLLRWAGLSSPQTPDYQRLREQGINQMADAIEEHLDLGAIDELLGIVR